MVDSGICMRIDVGDKGAGNSGDREESNLAEKPRINCTISALC